MLDRLSSSNLRSLLVCTAAAILAACSDTSTPPTSNLAPGAANNDASSGLAQRFVHARVCPSAAPETARCHSWVRVDGVGQPLANGGPSGFGAADLQSAYGLASASANNGTGATIAIVDAYDDGNAEADLAVYRSTMGLPACTSAGANPCFRKVNQSGGTSYPRGDMGWAEEISLDLDMASAICPKCKILLVEASSNSFTNLMAAVNYAASVPGVVAISNSYGGSEFSSEASYESAYNHPGIAVTVSSGDNGYGVEFPAASQYVVAVGGTSLKRVSGGRGWSESAWSGAGSGCSAYITKPVWQTDPCGKRTVADVSAIADPNTGVAVYDTYRLHPGGWLVFGGTSVAAPLIAGVYALGGYQSAQALYGSSASLFDVTSGSNGNCGTYLCKALAGFDGPTGNGTPNGITSF